MTYKEIIGSLREKSRTELENDLLDRYYNDFARSWCDGENEKRIPYMGWFWRDLPFSALEFIPIGTDGEFVGFMMNNKWGYGERYLTREEAETVIGFFDEAMDIRARGGLLSDMNGRTEEVFRRLSEYMQSLKV